MVIRSLKVWSQVLSQFVEQNLLSCSKQLSERGAMVISLVGSTQQLSNLSKIASLASSQAEIQIHRSDSSGPQLHS